MQIISFYDFIQLACKRSNIRYSIASNHMRKKIKEMGCTRCDIICWLNWKRGVSQEVLAKLFHVSVRIVQARIQKVKKIVPEEDFPKFFTIESFNSWQHDEHIKIKF